jgi:DNA invertase Pin-like site-specific DNA recombinase
MNYLLHPHDIQGLTIIKYRRKSTEDEDKQVASLHDQAVELDDVNARLYVQPSQIVDDIAEAKSAKRYGNRPDFYARLIAPIERGKANAIATWHPNRLSRNAKDTGVLIDLMDAGKLKAIITKQQIFWNTPMDKFLFVFLCSQAKLENDNKGVDVKRAIKRKLHDGWRPGPAPVGYLTTGAPGIKTIIRDPERFPLVRLIFDAYLAGTSVPDTWDQAKNTWGLRTRKTKRMGGKPLSMSHIYKILSDPFYYGWFWHKDPESGQTTLSRGNHEPMITKEEYDLIQLRLGKKGKPQPKTKEFAYTGTMTCGECGSAITAEEKHQLICPTCKHKFAYANKLACPQCSTAIAQMQNPTVLSYTYYHCTKKKNRHCSQKSVRIEALEAQIDQELQALEIDEGYLKLALDYLNEKKELEVQNKNIVTKALQDAYNDVQGRLHRLEREFTSSQNMDYSLFTPERFRELKAELLHERDQMKARMQNTEAEVDRWYELSEQTFTFCAYARFHFANGDLRTKRIIFSSLGSNLTLKDKKLNIEAYKPYLLVKDALRAVRAEQTRFEPATYGSTTSQKAALAASSPNWLPGIEAVRTWMAQNKGFVVPMLGKVR